MLSLNIIGAGSVGRVLGRQFVQHRVFQLAHVVTRSALTAQHAVTFIGAGVAVSHAVQLAAADVTMLTVPDDQIASTCAQLAALGLFKTGSIVFHCSGAKASTDLIAASATGALVASVHPVRSFADPTQAATNFAGTICSVEGDAVALEVLIPALQTIQANVVQISAANKLLYHAGSVFASNYLVTLMDTAMQAYQAAGISAEMAKAMAEPLARQSLDNVFTLGAVAALTGPIARRDRATVAQQQHMVRDWDAAAGNLYAAFTPPTMALAAKK